MIRVRQEVRVRLPGRCVYTDAAQLLDMADRDGSLQEVDELKREIESLRTRLLRMSDVSRRITESLDLETVLQEVVDCACSLTEARYGALSVFDDSGQVEELVTSGITQAERRTMGPLPMGRGLIGFLNEVHAPLRLTDLSKHPRSVGLPEFLPPMKTFLGAPVRHLGETLGAKLVVHNFPASGVSGWKIRCLPGPSLCQFAGSSSPRAPIVTGAVWKTSGQPARHRRRRRLQSKWPRPPR